MISIGETSPGHENSSAQRSGEREQSSDVLRSSLSFYSGKIPDGLATPSGAAGEVVCFCWRGRQFGVRYSSAKSPDDIRSDLDRLKFADHHPSRERNIFEPAAGCRVFRATTCAGKITRGKDGGSNVERLSNARIDSGQLRSEAELDRVLPEIILLTPVDHLLAHCERKTRRAGKRRRRGGENQLLTI